MSLVSEALRKARQEAAEKGAKQRGMVFRTTVVLGSESAGARLGWIVAGIVAASALAGAGVAWWVLAGRGAAPAPAAAPHSRIAAASPVVPTPAPAPQGAPAPVEAAGAAAVAPTIPDSGPRRRAETVTLESRPAATAPEAAKGAGRTVETPGQAETERPSRASAEPAGNGERSFVIDANLGRVKLHLDYIVYKPTDPFAGINGHEVVIGSIIEGYTVEEIDSEAVHLRNARGAIALRVH